MLAKLIKYDLKSTSKTLIPLWITVLVLSAILSLEFAFGIQLFRIEHKQPLAFSGAPTGLGYFTLFLLIVLFAIFMAIIVFNIIFIIQRFWNGLLKEEGYLMFTLPVTPRALVLSKSISSLLVTLGSILVSLISVGMISLSSLHILVQLSGESLDESIWEIIRQTFSSIKPSGALLCILLLCAGILSAAYRAYAAMAIGQLSNKNRFLLSFAAYIGFSVILSFITPLIAISPSGDSVTLIRNHYEIFQLLLYLVEAVIFHIITEILLTRKLNLE